MRIPIKYKCRRADSRLADDDGPSAVFCFKDYESVESINSPLLGFDRLVLILILISTTPQRFATATEAVERDLRLDPQQSRTRIRQAVWHRYAAPGWSS